MEFGKVHGHKPFCRLIGTNGSRTRTELSQCLFHPRVRDSTESDRSIVGGYPDADYVTSARGQELNYGWY